LVYGSAFTSLELFCSTDKSVQKTWDTTQPLVVGSASPSGKPVKNN
jgi:hypothetical protein